MRRFYAMSRFSGGDAKTISSNLNKSTTTMPPADQYEEEKVQRALKLLRENPSLKKWFSRSPLKIDASRKIGALPSVERRRSATVGDMEKIIAQVMPIPHPTASIFSSPARG